MWVNRIAGRSLQDITQYPVFPWLLFAYDDHSIMDESASEKKRKEKENNPSEIDVQ